MVPEPGTLEPCVGVSSGATRIHCATDSSSSDGTFARAGARFLGGAGAFGAVGTITGSMAAATPPVGSGRFLRRGTTRSKRPPAAASSAASGMGPRSDPPPLPPPAGPVGPDPAPTAALGDSLPEADADGAGLELATAGGLAGTTGVVMGVGTGVGTAVGLTVGLGVGRGVGLGVGFGVGGGVGTGVAEGVGVGAVTTTLAGDTTVWVIVLPGRVAVKV